MGLYIAYNGAVPTTARQVPVATGTAIKTLLQLTAPATRRFKVVAWGISLEGFAAAAPGSAELVVTGTVAGGTPTAVTPTLLVDGDPASLITAGFSPTTEGTITTTRELDAQLVAPTSQYIREFSLGREPVIGVSQILRVRVHYPATVNAIAWIIWEE